nr:RNA-directed DNA polymerase, eukaryota, reverse transcriptase zinc-binding domain protein [Tanacetum cinerariifolium]
MRRARKRAYDIGGGILHAVDRRGDGEVVTKVMMVTRWGWWCAAMGGGDGDRVMLVTMVLVMVRLEQLDGYIEENQQNAEATEERIELSPIGRFRKGSTLQMQVLSREFSMEEIKETFWSCKSDRAPGCNASFITLIPKVSSPVTPKEYRPISLIGVQYKIIVKLLANRLVKIIEDIVDPVQLAFVKGRQILDGPMMVNEVIDWYKKKKKNVCSLR